VTLTAAAPGATNVLFDGMAPAELFLFRIALALLASISIGLLAATASKARSDDGRVRVRVGNEALDGGAEARQPRALRQASTVVPHRLFAFA
jgi:hypothetical protein